VETGGVIPIGKIVGAHGLNGTSRVHSYAESLSAFSRDSDLILRNSQGLEMSCRVEWAKPHTRGILLALKGVGNREEAENLIGYEICIERARLPELEEGTYYWTDLIGLSVYTMNGDCLGRIDSIIPTGSNDVYVVKDKVDGKEDEVLIPALESVVVEVDLERQIMLVDLPEGL
jgi:16S rRNA processing protein RimM